MVIIRHSSENNKKGLPGYDVVDELKTEESDYYIDKTYSNAFWRTGLEQHLKDLKVEYVVCCGYAANHCVLFTYNGARERGFNSAMLQNGLVGLNKDDAKEVQLLRDVVSYRTVDFMLGKL